MTIPESLFSSLLWFLLDSLSDLSLCFPLPWRETAVGSFDGFLLVSRCFRSGSLSELASSVLEWYSLIDNPDFVFGGAILHGAFWRPKRVAT